MRWCFGQESLENFENFESLRILLFCSALYINLDGGNFEQYRLWNRDNKKKYCGEENMGEKRNFDLLETVQRTRNSFTRSI